MRTRSCISLFGFFVVSITVAPAQQPESQDEADAEKRRSRLLSDKEISLPLPITSPRAVLPGTIEPLTPGQKATRALKNVFGPKAIANRVLLAGINHGFDSPREWPGTFDGFGMRLGNRMGHLAVREAIQLSTDTAFKLEPRYDLCLCGGFFARTGHAWKRVLVARTDAGRQTVSISNFAGAFGTPMIADQWYPDRLNTWNHKLSTGSAFMMWRGVTNMIREFWPDISRKARFLKSVPGNYGSR